MNPKTFRRTVQAKVTSKIQTSLDLGPWMLLYGGGTARTMLQIGQLDGHFRTRIRYRMAAVRTDKPGAWQTGGALQTSNGTYVEDLTPTVGTNLWIQFGLAGSTPNDAEAGEALVEYALNLQDKGGLVAAGVVQAIPLPSAASIPVGQPFSANNLAGVMAGFDITGVTGTLDYALLIRYFDGDPNEPGAWTVLDSQTGQTADTLYNTGDKATTPGTKLLAQLGVRFGGTNPVATIRVVAAARYA